MPTASAPQSGTALGDAALFLQGKVGDVVDGTIKKMGGIAEKILKKSGEGAGKILKKSGEGAGKIVEGLGGLLKKKKDQ